MKDYAQKALAVLVDQVKAKEMIAYFSEKIGDNLESCRKQNQAEGNYDFDPHLYSAYKPIIIEDDWGDADTYYRTSEEVIEVLQLCPCCVAAHHAVQDRKKWKKKLATLRGTATKIGIAAHKQELDYMGLQNKENLR